MSLLLLLLIFGLVLALAGSLGYSHAGYWGFSPAALLLLIVLVLVLLGYRF